MPYHINFDRLKKRLEAPLPGDAVRKEMQPTLDDGTAVNVKHGKPPREGAVLILMYHSDQGLHFPLIQRAVYKGIHSGQIALPGGKKETSDNDLFATSLREAEEEIGVKKSEIVILGSLSSFYVSASNFNVLPVIGMVRYTPQFVPEAREVDEIIQVKAMDFLAPENKKIKDMVVREGVRLSSPYYHLQNKVVWGATAMMLRELEEVLKEVS